MPLFKLLADVKKCWGNLRGLPFLFHHSSLAVALNFTWHQYLTSSLSITKDSMSEVWFQCTTVLNELSTTQPFKTRLHSRVGSYFLGFNGSFPKKVVTDAINKSCNVWVALTKTLQKILLRLSMFSPYPTHRPHSRILPPNELDLSSIIIKFIFQISIKTINYYIV